MQSGGIAELGERPHVSRATGLDRHTPSVLNALLQDVISVLESDSDGETNSDRDSYKTVPENLESNSEQVRGRG